MRFNLSTFLHPHFQPVAAEHNYLMLSLWKQLLMILAVSDLAQLRSPSGQSDVFVPQNGVFSCPT